MDNYYWTTEHYHQDNTFTMNEYLDYHLPEGFEVVYFDGTYSEVVDIKTNKLYGLHASGNGDSFNHKITWEDLCQTLDT